MLICCTRGYRMLLLRGSKDDRPSQSLAHEVEHEALLMMLARRSSVTCPAMEVLTSLPDGSMALAVEHVDGQRLDALAPSDIDDRLLDAIWQEATTMHAARIAHRSLHVGNILVADGSPVIIDFSFAAESADERLRAIDRASYASFAAACRTPSRSSTRPNEPSGPTTWRPRCPTSNRWRSQPRPERKARSLCSKRFVMTSPRPPVKQRSRWNACSRPTRTVLTIAALAAAFYFLLPQLANVPDSLKAARSANWVWLLACVVLSLASYVAGAIGTSGSVNGDLPLVDNVQLQLASSFVNRVSPANVGGMALNVRFLQKSGIPPAGAVTGMGLNAVAGAIVHLVLLVAFFSWAGQAGGTASKLPAGSRILAILAVLLAVAGIFAATRRGRRLIKTRVFRFVKQSWSSIVRLAQRPAKLAALFGGSLGVTLSYICASAAALLRSPPTPASPRWACVPRGFAHRGCRTDSRGPGRSKPRWSPV